MSSTQPPSDSLDPPAQIDQTTTGDRNQMIGQANHSTVINGEVIHLMIHDRVPENSAPPLVSEVKPLTQQEYRQRQVLLNKVRDYWVKGVLEKSLHARVLIEFGLQERLDLVQQPFSNAAEFAEAPGQALPEGTDATTVFAQMGVGRTLLILGEPGSGKTITLLKLAEDLLVRTETDLRQPIPVVLNLSSWARKTQTIAQWLVQELLEKYQVSVALGKIWVETEALILLLDGLDEVKAEQRNACVQALNQFMQTHGTTEVTICCRIRDYQALPDRLILRSAVCIQPLMSDQIDRYFEQAGEQLKSLKTVLNQDEELQGLAVSPLMLSVMSLAYQGCTLEDITLGGTAEDYRQHLLDIYVERMFKRRGTVLSYSREQTQYWLNWLAQRMTQTSRSVFLIEQLQPIWLQVMHERMIYSLINGLAIYGLINCLIGGIFYGLVAGLIIGLASGLIFGLICELSDRLNIRNLGYIKTVETLKWSWRELIQGLGYGLGYSLIFALVYGLLRGQLIGLVYGLIGGLIFGLIYGLLRGFRGPEINQKGHPNQGIISSAQNAAVLGLLSGLVSGLIGGLIGGLMYGVIWGIFYGLIGGLIGGGKACISHFILRLIIYFNRYTPWNYAQFLDYAADRLFLQKVGGGYIFVHRMLLEHFAAMNLEQEQH